MKKNVYTILAVLIVLAGVCAWSAGCNKAPASKDTTPKRTANTDIAPSSVAQRNNMYPSPPPMSIDKSKPYNAVVTTSLGTFKIKLLGNDAPVTVNNFVFLANQGFYNGITFHRIMKDFMIQTGDPLGSGIGGPGYKFKDELPNKLTYGPGIVAMANSGPNTNGSQFFICTGDQSKNLNSSPNYTIFGQVVEGIDVVQKIAAVPVGADARGEKSKPANNVLIQEITITEQ